MNRLSLSKYALFIPILALTACGSTNQDESKTLAPQLNHAYILIDQGNDSDAIALLNTLQAQGHTEPEVAIALASAYLHRSGISVITLYESFRQMEFDLQAKEQAVLTQYAPVFDQIKDQLQTRPLNIDLDQAVGQAAEAVSVVDLAIEDLQKLPTLDSTQLPDLQTAYQILSSLTDLSGGNHLFRAVVGVVLLKQYLFQPAAWQALTDVSLCHLPISTVLNFVTKQLPILTQTVADVQQGYPNLSASLAGPAQSLLTIQSQLNSGDFNLILAQVKQYQDEGWFCSQ